MESQLTERPYVIGLDLGGTNAVFGIVDTSGNIVGQTSIKTQQYDTAEAFVNAGVEALLPLIEQVGGINRIEGIGIGAPNANYYTGTVDFAPNITWAHECSVPLARMFSDRLSLPVAMTNDANAAALGEMEYGVAKGMNNFIMITLGTGVGSGIVLNGHMVYGSDGLAGELGHVTVLPGSKRICGCGRCGCLEAYCSATGVARTAREYLTENDEPSLLREMPIENITSLDVCRAAMKGDALSKRVFDFTGELLGKACADFTAFCSPEAYVFFGGLAKSGDLLMKPLVQSYNDNVMGIFRGKAKFLLSSLDGAGAAVLGASAIARVKN